MVAAQGGDARVVDDAGLLPQAPGSATLDAGRDGFVASMDAEGIGRAAMLLGAGRERVDAPIDPAVGVLVLAKPGEPVSAGQPLLELRYRDAGLLAAAVPIAAAAVEVADQPPPPACLIRHQVPA
jgi:pyrimidine-nucleoside phosphorylase